MNRDASPPDARTSHRPSATSPSVRRLASTSSSP